MFIERLMTTMLLSILGFIAFDVTFSISYTQRDLPLQLPSLTVEGGMVKTLFFRQECPPLKCVCRGAMAFNS